MSHDLEVHRHSFVSGSSGTFSHSHDGGATPHHHPGTGPATYTIDKDEWGWVTGLRGGGRKKYTRRQSGPQMESLR